MYKIGSLPHSIPIGYTGETNFRTIEIDMTAWMEKMPAGVPSIVHIRPGESKADAYVAVTEFDTETNVLTWNITAADIGTLEGEGEMQIWLEEPDEEDTDVISKRGKSVKVTTKVTDAANDPSSTVPSSQEAFLEQVTSLKTQTVSAKEAAEDAQDAAETAQTAAETAQGAAEDAQEAAEGSAEDAEAYAKGTRDGSTVTSEDPAYHNNAKYYSEQAGASATAAGTAKTGAETAEDNAEAWAKGTKDGTAVPDTDPAYHNNAKYYSEQAATATSSKANLTVIAPAFDQAAANAAGSLVTYTDGKVYFLESGHTAGTTWANTTKAETNIGAQLTDVKTAIQGLEDILDIQEGSGGVVFTGDQSDDYKIQTNVSTLIVIDSSKTHSLKANVAGCTNINITKDYSSRFVITTFSNEPANGETGIRRIDNAASTTSYDMVLATGENWLLITYFHDDEDATRVVTTIKNSFVITSEEGGEKYSQRIDTIEEKTDKSYSALGLEGSVNLFDPEGTSANLMMTINQGQQAYTSSSKVHGMYCKIPSNTIFTVVKPQTSRFVIGTSVAEPVAGGTLTQFVDVSSSNVSYTLTSGANDKYFFMAYFHNDDDASKDIDTIIAGIKVFIGIVWREGMSNFLHPLSSMPEYMTKLLSYKPLGALTKPYICLSCDDGETTLATDTIPALKGYKTTYGQNIPVTFGLLDTSPVITNTTYKALVQEMVADYGCSVAVHGAVTLTELDEIGLQDELKKQKDALTTAGFTPNGIIYPQHSFNDLVCAVAGGQYGVCCTGGNYTDLTYGAGNACGYRSNMYALYRLSLFNSSMTTQKIHDYVDYIEANNMLMCAFWHDSSFAANHALLDELVSYAVGKGIDFITIGDILKIV